MSDNNNPIMKALQTMQEKQQEQLANNLVHALQHSLPLRA